MAATLKHDPSKRLAVLGLGLHGLGLAVLLAGVGTAYALVVRPLDARIDALDERAAELQSLLDDAHNVGVEHQRLRRAVATSESKAADIQKRVPDEPLEADFLSQLAQAADQTGFRIGDYRPGVVRAHEEYSQMQVQLVCEAPYRSICAFLEKVAALPRLTQVEKLDITAAGAEGYPVTLWLDVYFRPAKAPAARGAKGGQTSG